MAAPLGEFDLIARFFTRPVPPGRADIVLAVGDDCAVLQPASGEQWAVSTDTLVEGVHFLPTVDPAALGHKALAVNLSDLAACGAEPRCFFLALALPGIDEAVAAGVLAGHVRARRRPRLRAGRRRHDALAARRRHHDHRHGRRAAGTGAAAVGRTGRGRPLGARGRSATPPSGWRCARANPAPPPMRSPAIERLERPRAQVALGLALRGLATSAIDVSDGLLGDLGHILERSAVGARRGVGPRPEVGGTAPAAGGRPAPLGPGRGGRLRTAVHGARRPAASRRTGRRDRRRNGRRGSAK